MREKLGSTVLCNELSKQIYQALTTISHTLSAFESISLSEMEGVKLMNRIDTKYVFNKTNLTQILHSVQPFYKVVEIADKRLCTYQTQYYDTPTLELYRLHHAGKLNRYKVRHRSYSDSQTGFLEIKFKNNKGRTIKTRTKCKEKPEAWSQELSTFLRQNQPYPPLELLPSVQIDYKRITLVSKTSLERVTIDLQLCFKTKADTKEFEQLIIAEVKQDKRVDSAFVRAMKTHHIREGSISKYCMGIAEMLESAKKNNFKQKLRSIKKINI